MRLEAYLTHIPQQAITRYLKYGDHWSQAFLAGERPRRRCKLHREGSMSKPASTSLRRLDQIKYR